MKPTPEVHARYNRSPKGRARNARYRMTVKAMLRDVRAHAKERGAR